MLLGNFQYRDTLLIRIIVDQGPTVLAVGADGVVVDIFLCSVTSLPFLPFPWKTARYRLKYSRPSLSRLRLSRITAYLEEKIVSLF